MDNHPRQKSTRVLSIFHIFMILYGTAGIIGILILIFLMGFLIPGARKYFTRIEVITDS